MKTFVCVNESEQARAALRLAADLATALGSELVVGAVIVESVVPPTLTLEDEQLDQGFERVLDLAKQELGEMPFRYRTGLGPAVESLIDLAQEEAADLIVVGPAHRAGLGRAIFGSVGLEMSRHGPCPVAVAPSGYARLDSPVRRIGVGYDGSNGARQAIRVAAALAPLLDAPVDIVAIESDYVLSELPVALEPLRQHALGHAERGLAQIPVAQRGKTCVATGDPAETLESAAYEWDLLVVGSRGHGRMRGFVERSVSARLIAEASCPVIVVPPLARSGLLDARRLAGGKGPAEHEAAGSGSQQ